MLDTSCAALLRLAQSVHAQGYKVALTGEGADEALAGYVWYKTPENPRRHRPHARARPAAARAQAAAAQHRRQRAILPPERAIGGVRPAQQDLFELISQAKPSLYSEAMWQRLGRSQSV